MTATTAVPARAEVRRPMLVTLVRAEARKLVSTRGSAVMCVTIAVLVTAVSAVGAAIADADSALAGVALAKGILLLLLPLLALYILVSEWSSRSAVLTFSMTPRRGRVLWAKVLVVTAYSAGAITLAVVAALVVALVRQGPSALAPQALAALGQSILGVGVGVALQVALAGIVGLLLTSVALATIVYLIGTTALGAAISLLAGDLSGWFSFDEAAQLLSAAGGDAGTLPQALTALFLWLVLPGALGWWRYTSRETK